MFQLLADAASSNSLAWWQIVSGILAIPIAIVGLIYTLAQMKKTRLETAKLERELTDQKREIDELTRFLFFNFINENELKHLQGIAQSAPYSFEVASYAADELRHLRDSGLIIVRGKVGALPRHLADLHEYASLTERGHFYLSRLKDLAKT